jgi:hypothetical protein
MIDGFPPTSATAIHINGFGQVRSDIKLVLAGGVCAFHVEPLLVLTISVPPTAVHSMVVTHEIDCGGKDAS